MKIFVDTNYFLRFLIKDNEKQSLDVKLLFESADLGKVKLFSSTIVIFEIYWVLVSSYKVENDEAVKILSKILDMNFINFRERTVLQRAVEIYFDNNIEFEDCYNLAYAMSFDKNIDIATFDIKLQKVFKKLVKFTVLAEENDALDSVNVYLKEKKEGKLRKLKSITD